MATLDDVLSHEFSEFLIYCKSRHAEEGILFWNAIEAFKRRCTAIEQAHEQPPLEENATFLEPVNVPASTRTIKGSVVEIWRKKSAVVWGKVAEKLVRLHDVDEEERNSLRKQFMEKTENFSSARKKDFSKDLSLKTDEDYDEEMTRLARELYFVFLDPSTSKQLICVTAECQREIEEKLNEGRITSDVYDTAQQLVYHDMSATLLPGFQADKKRRLFPEHFKA